MNATYQSLTHRYDKTGLGTVRLGASVPSWLEPVAHAGFGEQVVGVGGVVFELAA